VTAGRRSGAAERRFFATANREQKPKTAADRERPRLVAAA
jgi:hypothetical protein